MNRLINSNLDLLKGRFIDHGGGFGATVAPDANGVERLAALTLPDGAGDGAEYFADRMAERIDESGHFKTRPINEAKDGEKDFMFLFGPSETLSQGRIIQVDDFGDDGMRKFLNTLWRLDKESDAPIICTVTSYGGSVMAGFGMIGFTRLTRSPVYTICIDTAYSMGAVFLAAAAEKGRRFATAHAHIMVHEISTIQWGQMPDLEAQTMSAKEINARLFGILADNSNLTSEAWMEYVRNKENDRNRFMFPEEAKEKGLIDGVLDAETYQRLFVGGVKS